MIKEYRQKYLEKLKNSKLPDFKYGLNINIQPDLEKINPKFVVMSVYEQGFTPKWAYTFAQNHPDLLIPVQGYANSEKQPMLIIYQYNNFKDFTSLIVKPSA